jgi:hypothetical protein
MKFYYEGLQDATLTYDGTADTGYPITNLQDMNKNTYFKDITAISGNELKIDLGSIKSCNYIALVNYKATGPEPVLTVYYSDDGTTYTATTLTHADISTSTYTNYVGNFTAASHRYWKLKFYDLVAAEGITIEIPVILLGAELVFNHNPELDIIFTHQFENTVITSQGGQRFAFGEFDSNRKGWQMNLKYINATFKTKLEAWRDEVMPGELSRYPFLFYDDTNYHYVRSVGPLEFQTSADVAYDTTLILSEEL